MTTFVFYFKPVNILESIFIPPQLYGLGIINQIPGAVSGAALAVIPVFQ
jgi:hypothetical protein